MPRYLSPLTICLITIVAPRVALANGYAGCLLNDYNSKSCKWQVITAIVPDSPADKAGLKLYDVIKSVDGNSAAQLEGALTKSKGGDQVHLEVQRSGEDMSFTVQLDERPIDATRQILEQARDLISRSENVQLRHSIEEWPAATDLTLWHSKKGEYHRNARYISMENDETVLLKDEDGHVMHVRIDLLDQEAHDKLDRIRTLESKIGEAAAQLWWQQQQPQSPKSDDSPQTTLWLIGAGVVTYYLIKRMIYVQRTTTNCPWCSGNGRSWVRLPDKMCPYCDPSLFIGCPKDANYYNFVCGRCNGKRWIKDGYWLKCVQCDGRGRVPKGPEVV